MLLQRHSLLQLFRLLLFCVLLFSTVGLAAQEVRGVVLDDASGTPLPGAHIQWQGTLKGTTSDNEGRFSLLVTDGLRPLLVGMTSYVTDTVMPQEGVPLEVRLKTSSKKLRSVAVRQRRKNTVTRMSSIAQTEVITVEGLKGLACCNLGESFENSATVDVGYSDAVSGSKQIQLLGLTGVYSQMLLENTLFLRGLSAPFGLGYVPGQWMESISVSKGVATVKNGYDAITGTINLEYEKPAKGDRFSLNLYENSDLKSEVTAKLNHRFNNRLSTGLLFFGTYNARRADHIGHDGFADYPLQQQFNVVNRWDYEAPSGFRSQTLVNYIHEERLGGDMRFERSLRDSDSIYGFGGTTDRLHFFTKNGFMLSNTASFGSQVSGTWFRQSAYYGLSDYRGEEKDLYVNLLVNAEVSGGHMVDYGLSLRYEEIDESLRSQPYLSAAAVTFDDQLSMREVVPGAFGQYTFRYGDDFNATAGLRYDYNSHYRRHLLTPRLHFRWRIAGRWVLRGSGGMGYRAPHVIAENFGLLASGRDLVINTPLQMEEAWNAGVNLTRKIQLGDDRELTFSIDYFHTDFLNQTVIDWDQDAYTAYIYNLDGRSYSNVIQADLNVEPFVGFSVSLAGKINDVRCNYNGTMLRKPYTSYWKGLLVLSYHTRFEKWRFDFTTQLNGPQRLPLNKGTLQGEAPAYLYMLGQVTRKFKRFEVYAGVENITGYVQETPVIGYDAPFSQAFDASVVYAPLMGRLFYAGLRFNIR